MAEKTTAHFPPAVMSEFEDCPWCRRRRHSQPPRFNLNLTSKHSDSLLSSTHPRHRLGQQTRRRRAGPIHLCSIHSLTMDYQTEHFWYTFQGSRSRFIGYTAELPYANTLCESLPVRSTLRHSNGALLERDDRDVLHRKCFVDFQR